MTDAFQRAIDAQIAAPLAKALDDLNEAERLGVMVGAMYGQVLAERDQAIQHLEAVLAAMPAGSWAHTEAAADEARAWIQEYRTARAVDSNQSPEQEPTDAPSSQA